MDQDVTQHLGSIVDILALERVDERRFRAGAADGPPRRSFGGQVAGQAVLAAGLTVPAERRIHSAHTYFLRPGDTSVPTEFEVREIRDGGAFTTRAVDARQSGKIIFTMTASFHRGEPGLEHQVAVLDTPPADELPGLETVFAGIPEALEWIRTLTDWLDVDARFPMLPARAVAALGQTGEPHQTVWLRSREPVSGDDPLRHAACAMYFSDLLLLSTALGPHGRSFQDGDVQFATINHAVWFHAPLRVDEWFLYEQYSRWAGGARALAHGEMLDSTGRLCVTTIQEGLVRVIRP